MKAGKSKKCKRENLCQGRNTEIVAVKSVQSKEKINCNEGSSTGRGVAQMALAKANKFAIKAIFSPQLAPGYPFASVNWKSKLLRKSIRSELGSWQVGSISQVSFIALLIVVGKHWAGKCHFLFPDLEREGAEGGGGFSVVNLCICQATFSWNFQSLFILRVSCLNVPLIREDNNKQAHLTICGARAAHEKHIQIRRPKVTNKQTSRQANQSLPWDRPNPNWTRKKGPGRALDLNSAWWSVDNLTDLFIYESQMHLSPSCLAPSYSRTMDFVADMKLKLPRKANFIGTHV